MRSTLSNYLSERAGWREEKAEQYPEDGRKARSAAALHSLAAYVDSAELNARTAIWFLGILEYEGKMNFGQEGRRLVGRYGFDHKVIDSTRHDAFLAELQQVAASDAYEFAATEIGGWRVGVNPSAAIFKPDRSPSDAKISIVDFPPSAPDQVVEGQGCSGRGVDLEQPARSRPAKMATPGTSPCPASPLIKTRARMQTPRVSSTAVAESTR